MKKGKLKVVVLSLITCSLILSGNLPNVFAKNKAEMNNKGLKIGLMSDTHYFSNLLYSNCPDFTKAENADRKMFKESDAILNRALEDMIKDKPDLVLISGDLTKDGERINHEMFSKKLAEAKKKLSDQGVNTKFYVINGNHDINNPNSKDFSSGSAIDTDTTTVEEFKEIYRDFGYGSDTEQFKVESDRGGSLSYVTRPIEGYTLIAVDSGKYSSDQTTSNKDIQETGGIIGQELLKWVSDKAHEAKKNGDVVMVMQHHGVVPHFDQEPVVMKDYLVDNYLEVQQVYADAGVSYVFTGHMHANDIATYTSPSGNTLYDIETGSLLTYPSYTRLANITNGSLKNGLSSEMKVKNNEICNVEYRNPDTNQIEIIDDLKAYGKERTLSPDIIKTMINEGVISPMIDNVLTSGGINTYLSKLLGTNNLSAYLVEMIANILPQSKEEGLDLSMEGYNFKIYYDISSLEIKISQNTDKQVVINKKAIKIKLPEEFLNEFKDNLAMVSSRGLFDPIELKIPKDKLVELLNRVFVNIDNNVLKNKESIYEIINTFIDSLLNKKIDETHTVFELINYIYQIHLAGDEACEPWAKEAIRKIKEEGILKQYLVEAIKETQLVIKKTLSSVSIDLSDVIEAGNNSIITNIARNLIIGKLKNGGDLVDMFDISTILPEGIVNQVNELAYNVAYSMSHDNNYTEDNNTTITIARTKVEIVNDANRALKEACEIEKGNYTDESYDALQKAILSVETVITSDDVQELIDAVNNLQKAIGALVEKAKVNKLALQIAVVEANKITEEQLENVVFIVVETFKSALKNANDVLENDNATQLEVSEAFNKLAEALHMLSFIKGDKTKLNELISEIETLDASLYTEVSWDAMNLVLIEAKSIVVDVNALEKEVEEVYDKLLKIFMELELKVDKNVLNEWIDKVSNLNSTLYTKETWKELENILVKANKVFENESAIQKEIDDACNDLIKAYLNLRLVPNKDLLEGLIKQVEGLQMTKYSQESWKRLQESLNNTKLVLINNNSTQQEINLAYHLLKEALNGLEVKTLPKFNESLTTSINSLKTGDDTDLLSSIGLMGLLVIMVNKKW